MGETKFEPKVMTAAVQSALSEQADLVEQEMRLTTPGGRYQVRRDDTGSAGAMAHQPERAWLLSILDGQWRYAHITGRARRSSTCWPWA